ncbi:MAG: hypothetical protein IPN34_08930 [Planctomycetes bacterium]|nr:hypothetical protein [Planctomycetota bacterium]
MIVFARSMLALVALLECASLALALSPAEARLDPPANDECWGAVPVSLGLGDPLSNAAATASPPSFACGSGGSDLWYLHVATCSGTLTADTCEGSDFDTLLEIFAGDCASLASLGCNDDDCGQQSRVAVRVFEGASYWIRVGGWSGDTGNFRLRLACEPAVATPYEVSWQVQTKPNQGSIYAKLKSTWQHEGLVRSNQSFASGPLREGAWDLDARGKAMAVLSIADLQRIVDDVYGSGAVVLRAVRDLRTKLKLVPGRPGKPARLQLAFQFRADFGWDGEIQVKGKLAGTEIQR